MVFRDWTLLVILSLLWGGSFFLVAVALDGFSPFMVVAGRVSIASVALGCYGYARGLRPPSGWRDWRALFVMGFLNNALPFTLIAYGQQRIDSGLASIFNATTPLFTVLFAHALTQDERLTGLKLLGIALGFAGVVAIVGPGVLGALRLESLSQCAVLAAAVSYGAAAVYGRRLRHLPTITAAAGMLVASSLLTLPVAAFELSHHASWNAESAAPVTAIAAMALLSTAVAYVIYFRLLASAGSTNLALVTFLIPVTAIALGAIFRNERLGLEAWAGMAFIFAGLVSVDGRLFRRP
jgi:drug/metabolite transporter (DMT)-like permease